MDCPANCRCGKHNRHDPRQNRNVLDGRTFGRWERGYAAQQAARVQRASDERRARGIGWRDTPSDDFDFDAAIQRLYGVFDRVYGKRWRRGLRTAG